MKPIPKPAKSIRYEEREADRLRNRKQFRCPHCGDKSRRDRDEQSILPNNWLPCHKCGSSLGPRRGRPMPPLKDHVHDFRCKCGAVFGDDASTFDLATGTRLQPMKPIVTPIPKNPNHGIPIPKWKEAEFHIASSLSRATLPETLCGLKLDPEFVLPSLDGSTCRSCRNKFAKNVNKYHFGASDETKREIQAMLGKSKSKSKSKRKSK